VRIAGLGDLAVEDVAVSPTGFGGYLSNKEGAAGHGGRPTPETPIGVRAYPIDDPVASQWKRWMRAVYADTGRSRRTSDGLSSRGGSDTRNAPEGTRTMNRANHWAWLVALSLAGPALGGHARPVGP
jgi:hypothetical protein